MLPDLPKFDTIGDLLSYGMVLGVVLLTIFGIKKALSDIKKTEGPSQASVLNDTLKSLNESVKELTQAERISAKELHEQNKVLRENLDLVRDMDKVMGAVAMHLSSIANNAEQGNRNVSVIRDLLNNLAGRKG